jgi:myo-inositol-1(or 4)-monophosphatase
LSRAFAPELPGLIPLKVCQGGPVTAPGAQDIRAAHDLAVRLAREAGALQMRERAGVTAHTVKAHANDLVSHVDLASEALIIDGLRAAFPSDGVLGEEGGGVPGTSGRRWIIDPLDGTRNYLSGAGPWSVCIALQDGQGDDDLALAVVHDPVVGETFSAISGEGSFLDGAPVTASDRSLLGEALAGLSFDPSPSTKQLMADVVAALLPEVGDIRRVPAALDLAYLACGRFDCAVLAGTKLWDVAAGLLLAREAGVVLGGVDGRPTPALILAAAPGLWDAFSTCDAAEHAVGRVAAAVPRPTG